LLGGDEPRLAFHLALLPADLGQVAVVEQWLVAASPELVGIPIYAGGDDFLAFCPAVTALRLASRVRSLVQEQPAPLARCGPGGSPITASTAVVFTHVSDSLQDAVVAARAALQEAKDAEGPGGRSRSRDALAVVVRRRGGERARTIQPWDSGRAAELLSAVQPRRPGEVLSAGLASRLEWDRVGLLELVDAQLWATLSAEMHRVVLRQGGTSEAAGALSALGRYERVGEPDARRPSFRPAPAALVARFLTQECR
jgi:hypothetical protein